LSILSKPATPSVISGASSAVCAGTTGTYSVTNVAGVTYNWTAPANASIASGQGTNSVSVSFSALFTSGSLTVSGSNACGTSALRTLSISSKPAQPGTITGPGFGNCNATATYSIVAVAYATSYTWTTNIAGAVVTPSGTSASISFPAFTSGTVSVTANNTCGSSAAKTLTVKGTPATPASITGPVLVCANQFGVPYSIAAIPTATSYTWTGMTGSHISDGVVTSSGTTLTTTSTSVTVNFGSTSGNLNVKANNACGAGTNKTLAIAFNCREINDENLGQDFDVIVRPNPVHDQLNISFESDESTVYSIQLIDLMGKVILQLNGVSVTGENNCQFTPDKMAKGMYFLKVINGEKKNISRVTVN
ncbi:MAG TPA: T9SS type A sorting domain-containing protein, partial [Bacteroidia bacterium]|nr:T9SS type A sorting domain-containing protein [Bacteroidia bacterium]